MSPESPQRVTELLRLPADERAAHETELLELVYRDLRALAASAFRAEAKDHTLQPTAVVHEAWMRLGIDRIDANDRGHFFALAARAMRQVLVDHARRRGAVKRGHASDRVTLAVDLQDDSNQGPTELDVIELDRALTALAERFERQAKVAELRYIVGLSIDEVGEALGISEKTVRRDWRFARSWLQRELSEEAPGED